MCHVLRCRRFETDFLAKSVLYVLAQQSVTVPFENCHILKHLLIIYKKSISIRRGGGIFQESF